jgi:hypothetical protein
LPQRAITVVSLAALTLCFYLVVGAFTAAWLTKPACARPQVVNLIAPVIALPAAASPGRGRDGSRDRTIVHQPDFCHVAAAALKRGNQIGRSQGKEFADTRDGRWCDGWAKSSSSALHLKRSALITAGIIDLKVA